MNGLQPFESTIEQTTETIPPSHTTITAAAMMTNKILLQAYESCYTTEKTFTSCFKRCFQIKTSLLNVWGIIIHPIFALICDCSKHTTWLNIPLLKLGNIWVILPKYQTPCIMKKISRTTNAIASIWLKKRKRLDIWPLPLSLSQSSQFSLSFTLRKLFPSWKRLCLWTNI